MLLVSISLLLMSLIYLVDGFMIKRNNRDKAFMIFMSIWIAFFSAGALLVWLIFGDGPR